jgi:hypothetical protein
METRSILPGLTLFYDPEEGEAAELIRSACEKSVRIIQECWGLEKPKDCRVYVMTSWLHFLFHSPPWPWRILVALSMPLLYFRASRLWQYAGGWAQGYGERRAIGIKPPRLLQLADRSIGNQIFVRKNDINQEVQHVTCHELVHAFTSHLKLPMWLNEGLAMVTVDKFSGTPTVIPTTIETLCRSSRQADPGQYRQVQKMDQDTFVYHCVRGYWITRYIEEIQPELLKSLLAQRLSHGVLENKVAAAFGMDRAEFWNTIDRIVVAHFEQEEGPG